MQDFSLSSKLKKYLWASLVFTITLRLLTIIIFPLTDTTEARYAELARKMLETGNWVTPQYDYGVPFWAKPPLSMWSSAFSMSLFGVNEFAARLPSFIFSIGILFMIWWLAKSRRNKDFALLNIVILYLLPLFFIASGTVMTDGCLTFCVCLSFTAFWLAIDKDSQEKNFSNNFQKLYGYLFFIGIGLGLLAKGPMCLILTLPPIIVWQLTYGQLSDISRLPWITGTCLILLIAAPWYILAEQRTPGFLNYFIIGEHIKRFLVPGWSGDLYGHAHRAAFGTIWFYMLLATFPWFFITVYWVVKKIDQVKDLFKFSACDKWIGYLFYWTLWPLLFFTVAKNIILPYVLTTLISFVLLITEGWIRSGYFTHLKFKKRLWFVLLLPSLVISVGMVVLTYNKNLGILKSQQLLAQQYLTTRASNDSKLYFYANRSYSAEFYSAGAAKNTNDFKEIEKLLDNNTQDFIAIKNKKKNLLAPILGSLTLVGVFGEHLLYVESK